MTHERGCEAELAGLLAINRAAGLLPDLASLRARFAPDPASLPDIHVPTVPLAVYQELLDTPVLVVAPVPVQEHAA